MSNHNVEILIETLQIINQGSYHVNNKTVKLRLSKQQIEASTVLLPEDIQNICSREEILATRTGTSRVDCVKQDSFAAAIQLMKNRAQLGESVKPVLVLNFANPVNIGGGVYKGASTQEEDLCRRSSLLRSLENSNAWRYYAYNRSLHTHMGSDAMIFSPEVEIIRDEDAKLIEETAVVSVLTCAAPMISYGMEGMSEDAYREMFGNRIKRMLKCAAYFGYEDMILGAWGCGAFGNDAAVVAELFLQAFDELQVKELFRNVVFAVRSRGGESYNFREFYQRFGGKEPFVL